MALRTVFTETFGIRHPIALAPMGGSAGGALAAAVSNGGGLGLIGGGRGDREWLDREVALATAATDRPWGIGFLTWAVDAEVIAWALEKRPSALMLSFGDPMPFASRVRDAGVPLIVQVTDLDEAKRALDAGADLIVAQGGEAGGHGKGQATLPFVPVVVDLAGPTPVLAAGGIADGRGVAAALVLGAVGALVGTRFQASPEALVSPETAKAILDASGADTDRNRIVDIAREAGWPAEYTARTVRDSFLAEWHDREDEPEAARRAYRAAVDSGAIASQPVWAGQAADLITAIEPAADLVDRLAAEAEQALSRAGRD
ncbi:NAD(P)H-dependent flavin oxidoreductase [Fodinicola acaciae]|uniref:NAD(P)H-dependent flavin oxidoreductase n=1 Tax=Fodinicola acaciae TaxID=2681555 RepID=UPI0013D178F5|nr:nitronate monooxygenase [Fodinicola acaciae]